MISFIIIILVFILLIFLFDFDTNTKRGFLNSLGLDLSEEQIEKFKEKDLNHNAKALIGSVEENLKIYSDYSSLKSKKEKLKAIYDKIDSDFSKGYSQAAIRAMEILEERIKKI